MKQLAGGKHMENDSFPRTLKFEMYAPWVGVQPMFFNPRTLVNHRLSDT
jgi:hypothetical protein